MNADYNRHKDNRNKIMLIFHPNNSPTLCLGASRPLSRRAFGMANAANGIFDSAGSIGNDEAHARLSLMAIYSERHGAPMIMEWPKACAHKPASSRDFPENRIALLYSVYVLW